MASGGSDPFDFFKSSKRSEVSELENELNHNKVERRMEALKKVIAMMTIGKDVSGLFFPVLKCVETQNLELKKLVYLYIINYAKTQPDLAVLAVNTFRKDARERVNPLIRGLAVRTMGCIGVDTILDYLCDPLKDSMNDEDPYVRKTAVMCVAKLYEINQQRVEDYKFIEKLEEMISDGNGMVVSNAIAAISDIASVRGKTLQMNQNLMHKLLNAVAECSEWGRIYILDYLGENILQNPKDVDEIIQRVIPNMAHSNSAVVLSAAKVIMRYLDFISDTEKVRSICRKMAPPLISLMNSEPEIQYIAIRNLNLIIQKRPYIIDKEVRVFFCGFQDPLYVKLEKLEIMIRLSDLKNVDSLLNELKDYAQEVDVVFVRKAISAIGRIAIKLDKAADRCIQVLHQLINTKIDYVVQEAIIVIKDIFRKYPNKYESIIRDLCENLKALDNVDARASMIWIIGEYGERIDNAVELIMNFSENFKDEAKKVQLAILNASVKLFLKVDGADDLVQEVLKMATDESDNPDLRNRGYIYWRMLSSNPDLARKVILCDKPTISEDSSTLEPVILDKLTANIGTLASVYYKQPDTFVKKIRDRINERLDQENDEVQVSPSKGSKKSTSTPGQQKEEEYVDSMGVKRSDYIKDAVPQNTYISDLLGVDMDQNQGSQTSALDDLLGSGSTPKQKEESKSSHVTSPMDLLEMDTSTPQQQTMTHQQPSFLDDHSTNAFVPIPFQTVLTSQTPGQAQQVGLQMEAAFQRDKALLYLDLKITNMTQAPVVSEFLMKLNQNHFGVALEGGFPQGFSVKQGETKSIRLKCVLGKNPGGQAPQRPPVLIQAGIKCNVDLFYFNLPAILQVLLQYTQADPSSLHQIWQEAPYQPENTLTLPQLSSQLQNAHSLITRLQDHNILFLSQGQNQYGQDALYVYCTPTTLEEMIIGEISINVMDGSVTVVAKSQSSYMPALFLQAAKFLLSAVV